MTMLDEFHEIYWDMSDREAAFQAGEVDEEEARRQLEEKYGSLDHARCANEIFKFVRDCLGPPPPRLAS